MRKGAVLAVVAAALAAGGWAAWRSVRGGFRLSGSVIASPRLQRIIETPNMVLFVVAENAGGVPIAVKRFVNPRLPLDWRMGPDDLVLPGRDWSGTLSVHVDVNSHDRIGNPVPGDLYGSHRHPVRSGDGAVDVIVDSEIR